MSGPLSLSVSPFKVELPVNTRNAVSKVKLTNSGSQPETVTAKMATVSQAKSGCQTSAPPTWATVTPARVVLAPGQSVNTTVTIHVPASVTPNADVAAMFTAGSQVKGKMTATGTVGSQIVLRSTSTATGPACSHKVAVAPVNHSSGAPIGWIAVALVLLVIAGAVAVVYRSRRHAAR